MKKIGFPGQESFVVGKRYKRLMSADGGEDIIIMNPPALPVLPLFPEFNNMSCDELAAAVAEYKKNSEDISMTGGSDEVKNMYLNAMNKANEIYLQKGCSVKSPANIGPMPADRIDQPPGNTGIVPPGISNKASGISVTSTKPGLNTSTQVANSTTVKWVMIAAGFCALYVLFKK